MTISVQQPITIPINTSRSTTPTPFLQDDPETPTTTRHRSDTMMTTSSSSSSSCPHLQTPETPSILGVIHPHFESPDDEALISAPYGRKDSYGSGNMMGIGSSSESTGPGMGSGLSGMRTTSVSVVRSDEVEEVEDMLEAAPHVPQPIRHTFILGDIIRSSSDSMNFPSNHHSSPLDDPIQTIPCAEQGFPFPAVSDHPTLAQPISHHLEAEIPEYKRAKSSFKNAVRNKLERSKSSFKSFRSRREDSNMEPTEREDEGGIGGSTGVPLDVQPELGPTIAIRPSRSRLRSLLSISMSRSQSSASVRSIASVSSNMSASNHRSAAQCTDLSQTIPAVSSQAYIDSRDADIRVTDETPPQPSGGCRSRSSSLSMQVNADDLAGAITLPSKNKGKAREPSSFWKSTRPTLFSSASGMTITKTMPVAVTVPPRISRPRASSMPLNSQPLGLVAVPCPPPKPKVDLFGSRLAREMKVMILQKLVQEVAESGGNGRWDREAGGRRQLIRMTRVSKSWQSLCLDGQLWPMVHLAPFAPFLHPASLRRILASTQPFVTSLSLRGLDNLAGSDLHVAGIRLDNLTELDLRGCKRLISDDVASLISSSPNLRTINVKGLQAVSSEVIRTIARTAKSLRSLDVSRCWNISLCDLVVFLKMISPSQAESLEVLRLGGIKGYGTTSGEFLPLVAERLVNLETLDLLGCTHLFDSDFKRFADVYDAAERVSTLRHLIISGCSSLGTDTFGYLARRLPDLVKLEAAGMPDAYRGGDPDDRSLVNLLRSLPNLERVDLEGTGFHGGVTDRVLDVLTPAKGVNGVVGSELVELHIGYAREVTPEALIRLLRGCHKLLILEADNTAANNALMRDFLRRRSATAQLSVIDCRAITLAAYSSLAPSTRPRKGWSSYASVPFGYDSQVNGEMEGKAVLKTFWSWRRVRVPKGWREALGGAQWGARENDSLRDAGKNRVDGVRRRGSWRTGEEGEEGAGCVVM